MKFTTAVPIHKSKFPIDYQSKILSFGSCFAENMAFKFDYFKFQNSCNPFGILFHPIAIENCISRSVNLELFEEKELFFNNERWHNFDVHSDLSNLNKESLLREINHLLIATNNQIVEASHIIITYGTSWVYRNKHTNKLVANCHKVPQNQFDKELLSVPTIEESIQNTINLIEKINPNCTILFLKIFEIVLYFISVYIIFHLFVETLSFINSLDQHLILNKIKIDLRWA